MEMIEVYVLSLDGGNFITEHIDDIMAMIESMEIDEVYTLEKRQMTEEEYFNLPEFEGF